MPKPKPHACLLVALFAIGGAPILKAQKADSLAIVRNIDLAKSWSSKGENVRAEAHADSALSMAKVFGNPQLLADANMRMAVVVYRQSQYEEAREYGLAAAKGYLDIGDSLSYSKTLNVLGSVERDLGNYQEAIDIYLKGMELNDRLGYPSGKADNLLNIGVVHASKGDVRQSIPFYKKAGEIYRETGDSAKWVTVKLNLAGVQMDLGEYDSAEAVILEAIPLVRSMKNRHEEGRSYYMLGKIAASTDRWHDAEQSYLKSLFIFEELNSSMRMSGCLVRLSEVYQQTGALKKAQERAEQALGLANEIGSKNLILQSTLQLSSVEESLGNFKTALSLYKAFKAVSDSLENAETDARIAELEKRYESKAQQQQMAELTAENKLNELEIERQKVQKRIYIGLSAVAFIFLTLVVVQVRSKQKANRILKGQNALIEQSLQDREILLREIHHRVKNNLQFISSLLSLQTRHVKDPQALSAMKESRDRILGIALIHQKLYQDENLMGVNMADFIPTLCENLLSSHEVDKATVDLRMDVDEVVMNIDQAMPLGMIINELVTNALKYGQPKDQKATLSIQLQADANGLQLRVADNGGGFPKDFDPHEKGGFGYSLVTSLSGKLKGKLSFSSNHGAEVTLSIPKLEVV